MSSLYFAGVLKMYLEILYHFTDGTQQNSSPSIVSLKKKKQPTINPLSQAISEAMILAAVLKAMQ